MVPQHYICEKCNYEYAWSIHHENLTPYSAPYCPKCYKEFLDKNIPIGKMKETK
jgi:NAD-dependent SIR2 family protein deacetylase